jgi:hypothetical protein
MRQQDRAHPDDTGRDCGSLCRPGNERQIRAALANGSKSRSPIKERTPHITENKEAPDEQPQDLIRVHSRSFVANPAFSQPPPPNAPLVPENARQMAEDSNIQVKP